MKNSYWVIEVYMQPRVTRTTSDHLETWEGGWFNLSGVQYKSKEMASKALEHSKKLDAQLSARRIYRLKEVSGE